MASSLAVVALLQLVSLGSCITSTSLENSDKLSDDLEPQETGWLIDPLQKKARELEYITNKFLWPLNALQSPSISYGVGSSPYPVGSGAVYYPGKKYGISYPSYSSYGSYKPSYSSSWGISQSAPSYKPIKPLVPNYDLINWQGKASLGLKYQQKTPNYAADCFHPNYQVSSWQAPTSISYSTGPSLYKTPSATYGVPQTLVSKPISKPVVVQPPQISSAAFVVKASIVPQVISDGSPTGPSSSWSAASGYYPGSIPSVPSPPSSSSWSTASGYFPSGPSAPSASWASVSSNYPSAPSAPLGSTNPLSTSSSTASGNIPSSVSVPYNPSSASWSTISANYPSAPSAPLGPPTNPLSPSSSTASGNIPSSVSVPYNPSSAGWSTISANYPSAPSAPLGPTNPPSPSSSTASGNIPSSVSAPYNPSSAGWPTISANYPSGPSAAVNPATNSWSTVSGNISPSPANPSWATWSNVPANYPSRPVVSGNPSANSWSIASTYTPQAPSSLSWYSYGGNDPSSYSIPQYPAALSSPASSSVPLTPQSQANLQISPSLDLASIRNSVKSNVSPAIPQNLLDTSTPSPLITQGPEVDSSDEVVITPPPASAKATVLTSLPGPQVVLPQEPQYYPGLNYAFSYYPNVFVITNEQKLEHSLPVGSEKPSTESTTISSTSSNTDESVTSSDNSLKSLAQTTEKATQSAVSNSERSTRPLIYSYQPSLPTASGIYFSPPVAQRSNPLPVNFGAPQGFPVGFQAQGSLLQPYPTSLGYSFPANGQSVATAKTSSPPC